MKLVIDALAGHEAEALSALAARIWRHHYPPIIGSAQTEYMLAQRYVPDAIRRELACGDAWWDVLRDGPDMVGFASTLLAADGELKLDKLYVVPERQRQGLGGMLIAHACDRAARLGCSAVILAVNKHNSAAIAAYRKHGFAVREAVVKDIGGGFVMDDYIMVRRVGG